MSTRSRRTSSTSTRSGARCTRRPAPNHGGAQLLSFTGAVFEAPIVARVRITSGDAAFTATSTDITVAGTQDLVAMDDFVYGEPRPLGPDAQVTVGNDFFRSAQN